MGSDRIGSENWQEDLVLLYDVPSVARKPDI
jgi:hypothetical protein